MNTNVIGVDGRTFAYVLRESGPRIAVTQNDVRAIQLAKAALYAGTRLLMDKLGAVNTTDLVAKHVNPIQIDKPMPESLKAATA